MSRRRTCWESQVAVAWEICATGMRELVKASSYERRKEGWSRMGCSIVLFLSVLLMNLVTLKKGPNIHSLETC